MSGMPLLSADAPADLAEAREGAIAVPRPAGPGDVPVQSPVHRLQSDLLAAGVLESDSLAETASEKAPGWVRLLLPVGVSLLLWSVIFGFIKVVFGPFVA